MQLKKAGKAALIGAAFVAMSPLAQAAQTTDTDGSRNTARTEAERDRDFPRGLLGLLGLAGLLGLKRKEQDIVVDARRNP